MIFELAGSATNTITITKMAVAGSLNRVYTWVRTSTLAAGGTFTTPTLLEHDLRNPAPLAVAKIFTVAPVAGVTIALARISTQTFGVQWGFGLSDRLAQPITMRGATEALQLQIGSALDFYVVVEWEESTT